MRIVLVTAMFPPVRTGTSFYSADLARALVEAGHEVRVVTLANPDAGEDCWPFPVDRLPCLHVPVAGLFKHLRLSSLHPGNYGRLRRIVRSARAEVVLLVNHYLDIAFPAIVAARRNGVPLVVSVGTQMQAASPVRARVLRFLDRLVCGGVVFPACARILSWDREIHRYIAETHGRRAAAKSVIVPYGVDAERTGIAGHEHDYSISDRIIGVGAVSEQRDYVFHVRVFREMLRARPELRLTIVGHVYSDRARRLAAELGIAERVEFTGELPRDQVIAEMKRSALHWMMLSGRYVGLGTSTAEAMLLGVPVVSNVPGDLFGTRKLRDMEEFIHTDGRDAEGAAVKLLRVLGEAGLRSRIGRRGREFAREALSWPAVVRRVAGVARGCVLE
jgi:glycosyltransferase involved in cell wall biosynthesis